MTQTVTQIGYILPMSNDALLWNAPPPPLLWNAPPPPPRKPRPAERVWSLRKNGKQVDAELRSDGEYGWECLFLYNGDFAYGRRWTMRADALAEAEAKRRELDAVGWRDEKPAESAGFSGTNRDD